ncbi:MAG: hypothetical protein WAK86_13540 [Pseudonocardiaceae bacterium]
MSEKWYLRSTDNSDGDAHHCDRVNDDGTVTARCGLTFLPERRLFGDGPAVVRPPVDPIQGCPQCRAAGEQTEDPDGVAVRGLIEALSSPRSPRPLRKRFRLWTKKDGVNNV